MSTAEPVSPLLNGPTAQVRAARGSTRRAASWRSEALLRMFENVLEVGENPAELIVYASLGRAARTWDEAARIATALIEGEDEATLLLQTGALVGQVRLGPEAPRVLSAVNNTVGSWATAERFYDRAATGDTMWGGLTAAAWQYIGRQGVLQGTYELLRAVGRRHFGVADVPFPLLGRWMLTSGMGGMGSSQPVSAAMLGLSSITVEVDPAKVERLRAAGALDVVTDSIETAIEALRAGLGERRCVRIGLIGNAAEVFAAFVERDVIPDVVSDQTAAHDPRYGYVPTGFTLDAWRELRSRDPQQVETLARQSILAEVEAMLTMVERGAVAFENGNNLRLQARLADPAQAERISTIPGFMESYLRPLFAQGIGPFRWVAISGDVADQARLDLEAAALFPGRPEVARWLELAATFVPQQGLPARSCWLGHGERGAFAARVNELVADGTISAPVLFSRDHLDSAGMTNPYIGTEGMRDGSDGVTDWPLLDAMALAASGADLVAVHSGGGGYSGLMQTAGVSIVADGAPETTARLRRVLDADTAIGVMRHAQAGYDEATRTINTHGLTGTAPIEWARKDEA